MVTNFDQKELTTMKNKLLLLVLFCITLNLNSQNYNWAFRLGGSGLNDINNSVSIDGIGNVYVAGTFEGTVDFDPNPNINYPLTSAGSRDIFFAKYNANGDLIWANRMGSNGIDEAKFIRVNNLNNEVYLSGTFQNTVDFNPSSSATANLAAAGGYDVFFAKYSQTGALLFSRRIGNTASESISAMAINPSNGEFIISGTFSGIVDFDPNATTANLTATGSDMFIARYSSTFNYMNAYRNNGISITDVNYDNSNSMIFLTGNFSGSLDADFTSATSTLSSSSGTLSDVYISKYDIGFNHQWTKQFGGTTGNRYGKKLVTTGNEVILTGYHYGTVDLDPSASNSIVTCAGGSDYFVSILSGSTGTFINGFNIGGVNDEIAMDIGVDNSSNIYISGVFTGTTDFDPSINSTILTTNGNDDIFYTKYSINGNFIFANKVGAAGNQGVSEIAISSPDNLYLAANIYGTSVDFDPSSNTANISSLGGCDGALAKYKSCPDPLYMTSQASQNNSCALETVTLSLAAGFIGGGANWVWYSGSCGTTSVGVGATITISPTISANYYVRAEGGCLTSPGACSGANYISVTPLPSLTVTTSNSLICSGSSATITMSGASNYSLNSTSLPLNTAVVNPTTTITYTIIGESNGCINTSQFTQSVTVCNSIIDLNKSGGFEIYPNPTTSILNIKSQREENIKIINELGQVIDEKVLNGENNFEVSITELTSGIYYIVTPTFAKKFVVIK